MEVWVKYHIIGWSDSQEYKDEVEFRRRLLGERHWSSISTVNDRRDITVSVEEDIAILFKLKYPDCSVVKPFDKVVDHLIK